MKLNNNQRKSMLELGESMIKQTDPSSWNDFLFNIQNNLIHHGYFDGLTEAARQDHAGRFAELKRFFDKLSDIRNAS